MLDERLSLAAAMYAPCDLGADIGTDHGLLPCHLLQQNICQRMIFADVSDKALLHAREQVSRQHLDHRAAFACADGLDAITERCGCISIMGMGGETIAGILNRGQSKLQNAVLVLSAHTDLHLVRKAVMEIGYHIVREELCQAAGRYYVVWRAEPGAAALSDEEIRFGPLLMHTSSPLLQRYIAWRIKVLGDRLRGLLSAREPDESAIAAIQKDIAYYQARLEV